VGPQRARFPPKVMLTALPTGLGPLLLGAPMSLVGLPVRAVHPMEETDTPAAKKGGPKKQTGMSSSGSPSWRAVPMKKAGTSMKGAPKSMRKMANGQGVRSSGRMSGRSATPIG